MKLWDTAVASQGSSTYARDITIFATGNYGLSTLDRDSTSPACPSPQRGALIAAVDQVTQGQAAGQTPDQASMAEVANAGNRWLESIGRTDLDFDTP